MGEGACVSWWQRWAEWWWWQGHLMSIRSCCSSTSWGHLALASRGNFDSSVILKNANHTEWNAVSVGNYSFLREGFQVHFWRSKGDPVGTVTTWQCLWFPCHPLRRWWVNLIGEGSAQSAQRESFRLPWLWPEDKSP